MSLNLSVDLEAYPKDEEIGIEGIGRIVNGGESLEITPEMEENYFYRTGKTISDTLAEQEGISLTGSPSFTPPEDFKISDTSENVVEADATVDNSDNEDTQLVMTDNTPAIVEIPTGLPHQEGDN